MSHTCNTFSYINALIGATPAPGPTKITGHYGSVGNLNRDSYNATLKEIVLVLLQKGSQ
jgi:hypothetical protein